MKKEYSLSFITAAKSLRAAMTILTGMGCRAN